MRTLQSGDVLGRWVVDHVASFGSPRMLVAADSEGTEALLIPFEDDRAPHTRVIRALEAFDHPHIPRLLDGGSDHGGAWVAVSRFEADSVSDALVSGPVRWGLACRWLHGLALALQHIHRAGWVHRAVRPDAVFVGADRHVGQVRLLGLERAGPVDDPLAPDVQSGLAYAAPEALDAPELAGPRADLYAFGLVAYELLAGEPPFPAAARADGEHSLLNWKRQVDAFDPGPDVPDWLRDLVRKCTHPRPESRLPDMDSVVSWLEASRRSWEAPSVPPASRLTPMNVPREHLPALNVQPTFLDPDQLADVIAQRALEMRAGPDWSAMALTSGLLGCVAGLAVSALVVLYIELVALG